MSSHQPSLTFYLHFLLISLRMPLDHTCAYRRLRHQVGT
jgi:hypothetical protein